MLVEFSVSNFRSIREEQKLSMVATSSNELEQTHVFASGAPGVDRLLRSAAIYGANAAGKSNLLKAMDFMGDMVTRSARETEWSSALRVTPFGSNSNTPSVFEVVLVAAGVKYQFGFAVTHERVLEEWLYAFPDKRAQKWYHRKLNPNSQESEFEFGSFLKGPKQQWTSATRSNSLFLSTSIQLNAQQLEPVYEWFRMQLRVVLGSGGISERYSAQLVDSSEAKAKMLAFLNNADIAITDIESIVEPHSKEVEDLIKKVLPKQDAEEALKHENRKVRLRHALPSGENFWLELDEESQGTQRLFGYAGPLLDVLETGCVLVIDEVNNSLHPLLVKKIVQVFNDPATNKNNSQLIFACHATSVLTTDLLRRDQIWFAEKDRGGATHIYPLTDFSPRKTDSLARGYLQGRYGAVPFLSNGLLADVP
jgi:AAA15 family ATPase/GTPase